MNNITDTCSVDQEEIDYSTLLNAQYKKFRYDQQLLDQNGVGPYSGIYSDIDYYGFKNVSDQSFLYAFGDGTNNAVLDQDKIMRFLIGYMKKKIEELEQRIAILEQ